MLLQGLHFFISSFLYRVNEQLQMKNVNFYYVSFPNIIPRKVLKKSLSKIHDF